MNLSTQSFLDTVAKLTPNQLADLGREITKLGKQGIDPFEAERRRSLSQFLSNRQQFVQSHVHPDYQYAYQPYPKTLFCVMRNEQGEPGLAYQVIQSEEERALLADDWKESPGEAWKHHEEEAATRPQGEALNVRS